MTQPNKEPLDVVNSTGFLFQYRVAHEIESTRDHHGWTVAGQEHRWQNNELKKEGFIDIVVQEEQFGMRIAIECKKRRDKSWIFLIPNTDIRAVTRTRVHWTFLVHERETLTGWDDFHLLPKTVESSICVMQGDDDKNRSRAMLEQLADPVLASVEALADEELQIVSSDFGAVRSLYMPVIVTNCELQTCSFNPYDIDLDTGEIDKARVEFLSVPFIRFRKNLSTKSKSLNTPRDLQQANQENERTIFIVNAAHLTDFLSKCRFSNPGDYRSPWAMAQRIIETRTRRSRL